MMDQQRSWIGRMLCVVVAMAGWFAGGASAQTPRTKVVVDFKDDAVLKKILHNEGVTISRTADNMLKVHVTPFEEHKNQWPVVAFAADALGGKINLVDYSYLEVTLHHQSTGMSLVDFQIATPPDASQNVDYEQVMIPGQTTMTVRLSTNAMLNNDPSEIGIIQFIFRPRSGDTDYLVEPIRAVYDPGAGSPAEHLQAKLKLAGEQLAGIQQDVLGKLPADQQKPALEQMAKAKRDLAALNKDVAAARAKGFAGMYGKLSKRADETVGQIAKLRLLESGPLKAWVPDRYINFLKQSGPRLQDPLLKDVTLKMAGNEFRDFVFAVSGANRDLSLEVAVRPTGDNPLPADAVTISVSDYPKNLRGEYTGDALVPVSGLVKIPAGESRQFWVRFNTRTIKVPAGEYSFELALNDPAAGTGEVIPGKLEVWNFDLPGYDILPNNSYAIYGGGLRDDPNGEKFRTAVGQMKLYGLNYIFVEPPEIPVPTGLDDQWQITGYNDSAFKARINKSMEAWKQAPGQETLHFVVALSSFEDLGLKKEGCAFGNEVWKKVLKQYLQHLKSIMTEAGLKDSQWILALRDESSEPVLMQYDIPMAEAIKQIDPSIRLSSNSSTVLSDPKWVQRYFKAFDLFIPVRSGKEALAFLRQSGKPIWWYECDSAMTVMGRELYSYYRVYEWDMLDKGIVGTGIWTYISTPHDRPWGEDFQGCQLIYLHPEYGVIHSRRYEMYREGLDDYRYVSALRQAAKNKGGAAVDEAENLIKQAIDDITGHRQDTSLCEIWRQRMAQQIVGMQ